MFLGVATRLELSPCNTDQSHAEHVTAKLGATVATGGIFVCGAALGYADFIANHV